MRLLLDTTIAIHLRDGHAGVEARLIDRLGTSLISVVTRVELEGGVYKELGEASLRRARLDRILAGFEELPFRTEEAATYGHIVHLCGFSRTRILDRMIAATAIVAGVPLITSNARDFADVPGLTVEDWGDLSQT